MYLYWFRPYREGDGIKRLLDTKSDELKPVFFDGMTENDDSSHCNWIQISIVLWIPVLRIRIRIHVFFGLLDPDLDPLVRGMDPDPDSDLDPDPSIIKQK